MDPAPAAASCRSARRGPAPDGVLGEGEGRHPHAAPGGIRDVPCSSMNTEATVTPGALRRGGADLAGDAPRPYAAAARRSSMIASAAPSSASASIAARRLGAGRLAIMSIGFSQRGLAGSSREAPAHPLRELDDLETVGLAGIRGEDPGPPALETIATRRPAGTGWAESSARDVEQLVDRVGADHSRLLEQRIDGHIGGRQPRRRMRGLAARAGRMRPPLTATIGLAWPTRRAMRAKRRGLPNDSGRAARRRSPGPPPSTAAGRCRRCRPCCRPRRTRTARAPGARPPRASRSRGRRSGRGSRRCRGGDAPAKVA